MVRQVYLYWLVSDKFDLMLESKQLAHVHTLTRRRTMGDATPHVSYMMSRQVPLVSAMVVGSAVTMPRSEGALRGSLAAQPMAQSVSGAPEAMGPMASTAAVATTAAVTAAATG